MKQKHRLADFVFLFLFLGGIAVVSLFTLFSPRETYSPYENRALATRPPVTLQGLWDGSFFTQTETFLADQLAWREALLTVNTWAELKVMGKPVVNDQVVTGDVLLPFHGYSTWDTGYIKEQSEDMGARLDRLNRQIKDYGGYFCYLGVPEQFSYFRDRYPDYMDNRDWTLTPIHTEFSNALSQRGVPYVDALEVYDSLGHLSSFSSAIDHHYTYAGMLTAYTALMERINADTGLELSILSEDDLELTALPNLYLGSRSRRLFGLWPDEERLVIGTLKSPIPFTRTDNGVEVPATLYELPADEDEPVGFTVYMGGDIPETVIRTNRTELPNALIFGDSYTDPLETVFWTSFNETRALDLRYYTASSLEAYIAEYKPDIVVCVRDDSMYTNTSGNGNLPAPEDLNDVVEPSV